jgi:hypothetical protein
MTTGVLAECAVAKAAASRFTHRFVLVLEYPACGTACQPPPGRWCHEVLCVRDSRASEKIA